MPAPAIFGVEDDEQMPLLMKHAIEEINKDISLVSATIRSGATALLNTCRENKWMPGMILPDINLAGILGSD